MRSSAAAFSPDRTLIKRHAAAYGWTEENLLAVLSEFGPLSEVGQAQLMVCLSLAFCRHQYATKTTERVTPSKQRIQLMAFAGTVNWLLDQLKNPNIELWLAAAGIVTAGRDRAAINNDLRAANDRVADSVRVLIDLQDRALIAAQAAATHAAPGRGGVRRRPAAKGQLIKDAITIYAHMRMHHPRSGNRPGLGGPMLKFIHAVVSLCGARARDPEICEVWRVWKSKRKQS